MSQLSSEELDARQKLLTARYRELWPGLMDVFRKIDPLGGWPETTEVFRRIDPPQEGSRCISKPFLLDMTAHNYCRASRRLFIVGKETQDWETHRKIEGDPITYLLAVYRRFQLSARYPSVLLRNQGARRLYGLLNPRGPADGFLWSNLVRVDENRGRAKPDVADAAYRHFNILPEEIRLAAPDVVVFFIGPDPFYERRLERTFPGLRLVPVEGEQLQELARVDDGERLLPFHTYRSYHPRHLGGAVRRVNRIAALCDARK